MGELSMMASSLDPSRAVSAGSRFSSSVLSSIGPTALSTASSTLLLGALPIAWYLLKSNPAVIRHSILLEIKFAVASLLIGTEAGFLASRILNATKLTDGPVQAALLSLFAACSLRYLVAFDHQRTLSSSALLASWLVVSSGCDILRAWIFYNRQSSHFLFTTAVVLPAVSSATFKFCLFALSELPKHDLIKDAKLQNITSQVQTSGVLSRFVLAPLYKKYLLRFDDEMAISDLVDLDKPFAAGELLRAFNREWAKSDKDSPSALIRVCGSILAPNILTATPLRLLRSLFTVLQPLLIRSIVQYALGVYLFENRIYTGLALIGAAICVYGGSAISRGLLGRETFRMSTLLRGTLTAAVYQKTLYLTGTDAQQHTAMSVIGKSVESTAREVAVVHNIWADPLEFTACAYMLYRALGNATFLIILPTTISHCIGWYLSSNGPTDRAVWHKKMEARVNEVSAMLSEIKAIKSIGLDTAILDRIKKAHAFEVADFKCFQKWSVVLIATSQFCSLITYPLVLGTALTFAVWADRLSVVDAFTSMAVMAVMSEPLSSCSTAWADVASVATRLHKIQDFLLSEEIHGQRTQHTIVRQASGCTTEEAQDPVITPGPPQIPEQVGQNTMFELRDAAISMQNIACPVMERITAKLARGDIVMIVGRAGSGKTSLLRTLISETRISAGYRYKAPGLSTAYCGQSAWLWNQSIRRNILAYNRMDTDWYSQVLDACLLKADIRQLPRSDKTIVGNNGNKLSGTQRQRIALARAIYSRSPILVLDDIFPNMDDDTTFKLARGLFGADGLLRRAMRTVVLVTHSKPMLRFATRYWLIDMDDHFIDQDGQYDVRFRRRLQSVLASIASDENVALANNSIEEATLEFNPLTNADTEEVVLSNQRADARRRSKWEVLLFYLQTFQYPKLLLWLGLAVLMSAGEKSPVAYVSFWLHSYSDPFIWFYGYILLAVTSAIFALWNVYVWWMQLVPKSVEYIHESLLETTMDASWSYLSSADMRSILTLFANDMFSIIAVLPADFLRTLYYTLNVSIQSAIIVGFSGFHAALVLPAIVAALTIIQLCYKGRAGQLTCLEAESQARFQAHLTDMENGVEHIRAFGWEANSLDSALRLIDASQKPFYHNHSLRTWLRVGVDTVSMCVGVLLTIQTVFHIQTVSASVTSVSMTTFMSVSANLPSLIFNWKSLQSSLGSLERIKNFIETTPRELGLPIKESQHVRPEWPEDGKVVMRNISAKYKDSDNSLTVLQDISLIIPPGRHVGIIGGTRSGKSSFTQAILNFLEYSGDIIIDGINIAKIPHSILRSRVTTISQDDIKFDESIRYNLCPWTMSRTEGNIHDDSIILMLKTLKLWHLVFINGGLDSPYKTLGLSPGQKKLICIARACLHKLSTRSRLVIIDGPLAGLDDEDRELALVAMDAAFFDCTIIEVAESADDLPDAHLILHIENGRIVKKELPDEGIPDSKTPPSPPPNMPTAPVPMNPLFQGMLDKSLAAEEVVNAQLRQRAP